MDQARRGLLSVFLKFYYKGANILIEKPDGKQSVILRMKLAASRKRQVGKFLHEYHCRGRMTKMPASCVNIEC